jgi:hypothetical protein
LPILTEEWRIICVRLAELGRRRAAELREYRTYMDQHHSPRWPRERPFVRLPGRLGRPGPTSRFLDALLSAVGTHHTGKAEPTRNSTSLHRDGRPELSAHPVADLERFAAEWSLQGEHDPLSFPSADDLILIAKNLTGADLGRDVTVDNDPRANAGHLHWRREPVDHGASSRGQVKADVFVALGDDPPSLRSEVGWFVFSLLLLVAGLAVLLEPLPNIGQDVRSLFTGYLFTHWSQVTQRWDNRITAGAFGTADALVTLLLLVPGLLLTRLDAPSTRTLLGRLRRWPRATAYFAVVTTSSLALCVATLPRSWFTVPLILTMVVLLVLLATNRVAAWMARVERRSPVPRFRPVPAWLRGQCGRRSAYASARECTLLHGTEPTHD